MTFVFGFVFGRKRVHRFRSVFSLVLVVQYCIVSYCTVRDEDWTRVLGGLCRWWEECHIKVDKYILVSHRCAEKLEYFFLIYKHMQNLILLGNVVYDYKFYSYSRLTEYYCSNEYWF